VLGNHDYLGDTLVQIGDALTLKDSRWFCQRSFQLKHSLCAPSQKGNNPGSRCDVVEERFSLEQSIFWNIFAGHCAQFVEFFFIDTTPFVNDYWSAEQARDFDWRELGPRQEYLDAQLEV
jgi:tartrate-resistant acid phosphatase type 5